MRLLTSNSDQATKNLLEKLEAELTIISLFTYACYFNNPEKSGAFEAMEETGGHVLVIPLSRADYQLALQSIERVNVLREIIHERLC